MPKQKSDTMSNVRKICKVIPQLSPSKSLLKKRSVKEKAVKEKPPKEQSNKEKSSKRAKEKAVKEQTKRGKPEKTSEKGLSSTEPAKESLSFKDLNSHFNSVQFSTKQAGQAYRSVDSINGQIDQHGQSTNRLGLPDQPPGNDLEERTGAFIGVGLKSQFSRSEDDR